MIGTMQRMGWRLGAFALMALLVRAIVPAGYMLAEADTASGRYLALELCDEHDGQPKLVDLDTGEIFDAPVQGKSSSKPPPCVFCGGLTAVAQPQQAGAEVVALVATQDVNFAEVRDLAPGRGIAAPPPPATGPPSSI